MFFAVSLSHSQTKVFFITGGVRGETRDDDETSIAKFLLFIDSFNQALIIVMTSRYRASFKLSNFKEGWSISHSETSGQSTSSVREIFSFSWSKRRQSIARFRTKIFFSSRVNSISSWWVELKHTELSYFYFYQFSNFFSLKMRIFNFHSQRHENKA
jgi:hypothetical protein